MTHEESQEMAYVNLEFSIFYMQYFLETGKSLHVVLSLPEVQIFYTYYLPPD